MILIFFLASVQVQEVQDIEISNKFVEHSRSADISVAVLKRSSESCENEKGNILYHIL